MRGFLKGRFRVFFSPCADVGVVCPALVAPLSHLVHIATWQRGAACRFFSPCAWLGGGLRRPTALQFCARREERTGGWRVPGKTLRSSCACREKRATVRPLRILLILRSGAGGAGLLGGAFRTFFSSCAGKPPCLSSAPAERRPACAEFPALALPSAPAERRPLAKRRPIRAALPAPSSSSRPPAWVLHTLPVQWTC